MGHTAFPSVAVRQLEKRGDVVYLEFSDVSDGMEKKVAVTVKNNSICCKETQKTESMFLQDGMDSSRQEWTPR